MTELEKKNLRLPFCFDDPEVDALKLHAVKGCQKLESIDVLDTKAKQAEVHLGDFCMIGPGVLIATVNHPMVPFGRRKHLSLIKPVYIGNDVWIGGKAVILPGVHIGNNCVIAAGAIVTHDVPDNTLVAGVPAKPIKTLEDDVERYVFY